MNREVPTAVAVPDDFPRPIYSPSVPGAAPKFVARQIDGKFTVGWTAEELRARWELREDFAQQLATRTRKKHASGVILNFDTFYEETARRVSQQDWGLSADEQTWLMQRARRLALDLE